MTTMLLRLRVLVAGLALVACKKSEPKPRPEAAPPPVAVDVSLPDAAPMDAEEPLTPAVPDGKLGVQVRGLTYEGYEAKGLPAIRADGALIVALAEGDDGGRGYLDLTAHVLDGAGAAVKRVRLTDPNQVELADDPDRTNPAAEAATRAAVAELNATLSDGTWRTLVGVTAPSSFEDEPGPLTAGDLAFSLDVRRSVLTIKRGAATVGTHKLTGVYKVPRPARADDACGDEQPYLHAVYPDAASGKALIAIGFAAGGHNCGAAGPAFAVVPLPR